MKHFVAFFSFVLISGCVSHQYHEFAEEKRVVIEETNSIAQHQLHSEIFTTVSDRQIADQTKLFKLSQNQKVRFQRYMKRGLTQGKEKHILLVDYLYSFAKDFDYRGNTLNARQAMHQKTGNCLSLAIVSTALAEMIGLAYSYQKVHSAPIYDQQEKLQLISTHINFKGKKSSLKK